MRRIKVSFTRNGIIGGVLEYEDKTLIGCIEKFLCDENYYGGPDVYPLEELADKKRTVGNLLEWLDLHNNNKKMYVVSIITDSFTIIYPR